MNGQDGITNYVSYVYNIFNSLEKTQEKTTESNSLTAKSHQQKQTVSQV